MASLVLSGDTSGSITVSAPAVAGSNTQTLAAVTGTLAPVVSGTAQTAPFTDNTRAEFTGIPSWAKRITVMFQAVGTNGSSILQVQVGSGSFSTSGYTAQAWSSAQTGIVSTGIYLGSGWASNYQMVGALTLSLIGSNTWVGTGLLGFETISSIGFQFTGRTPALSGALDRIRVLAVNGTDTFDTGSVINILFE